LHGPRPKGHPSGMPDLSHRLVSHRLDPSQRRRQRAEPSVADLPPSPNGPHDTPHRRVFANLLEHRVKRLSSILATVAHETSNRVSAAYSIKTNPSPALLNAARAVGFMAEAISLEEVDRACANGFDASEIVLNGPGKWWSRNRHAVTSRHGL